MSLPESAEPSEADLQYQYEHIFLPPDAGHGADSGNTCPEDDLMIRNILESLQEFGAIIEEEASSAVSTCERMIQKMLSARPAGTYLDRDATRTLLSSIGDGGTSV